MSISDAERRRQERRQRILNNQESRLKRILGSNSSFERENLTSSSSTFLDESSSSSSSLFQVTNGENEDEINLADAEKEEIQHTFKTLESFLTENDFSKSPNLSTENYTTAATPNTPIISSASSSSSKNLDLKQQQQHPLLLSKQIPMKIHHLLLVLIGLILSLFLTESYFLIYFILYQISIFVYSGCACPTFYSTKKSALLTLCILFGVPQIYRDSLEKITLLVTWLSTDLSIFITSALLPSFLSSLITI